MSYYSRMILSTKRLHIYILFFVWLKKKKSLVGRMFLLQLQVQSSILLDYVLAFVKSSKIDLTH